MSDMSWEHANEARAALSAIVNDPEHGVGALSSAQTMSNLLKDLLPDAPREKSILVAAAEAGIADQLRQHVGQGMDPDTAIRLTASSFSSTTPFTSDACSWVTGEIATALGMSHSQPAGPAGPGGAGGFGGNPPGFDPIGQQGMPTQVAQSPGGYNPGQRPGQQAPQGFGQGAAQGGAFGSAAAQETRPGQWQQPGQQGGFGQNQPGAPGGAGGYGQPGAPGSPGGYGGQTPGQGVPGTPGAGYAQPGAGGWGGAGQPGTPGTPGTPGYGQPGTPGYIQPGAPGAPGGPGGWQPGGGGFGPVPGGSKPRGSRKGLFIGGGIALVAVVAIVIGISLSGGGGKGKHSTPPPNTSPITNPTTPATSPPATSPAANNPPGTDPLATIMNPSGGTAVGTDCIDAKTFSLDASTLVAKTFCAHTTKPNIVVWGYQFDNQADYLKGVASINHYVGFDKVTPGTNCPPASGTTEGKVGWHANHNPKYKSRTGQDIECLTDGNKPVLIWTMPTQDVFFIGQDNTTGTSINTVIKWWETLVYGP